MRWLRIAAAGVGLIVAAAGLTSQVAGGQHTPTTGPTSVRTLSGGNPSDAAAARTLTYLLTPADSTPAPNPIIAAATGSPSAVGAVASGLAANGIPLVALNAYQSAANQEAALDPACGLGWPLLAAIGRVESDHGRFGGAVLRSDGTSTPRTIGPALDGNGHALIPATASGKLLDGDATYDHAVGAMQFIPSTWLLYRTAALGHVSPDPFNIYDAAATAARYLCAAAGSVTTPAGQQRAIAAYNHSDVYVATVLAVAAFYGAGGSAVTVPVVATTVEPGPLPSVPPVNPGPPPAITTPAAGPTPSSPIPEPTGATATTSGSPTDSPTAPAATPTESATPTDSSTPTDPPSPTASPSPTP